MKGDARCCNGDSNDKEPQTRELLIDLSVIAFHDAGTGIQRVVRATYAALSRLRLADFRIRAVAATRELDYRYLPDGFEIGSRPPDLSCCDRVSPRAGNVFLGLDLASMVMPHHEAQLATWRCAGMHIHIFLFDMLPLLHGEWFRWAARRNFRRWIRLVERQADSVICQCETVTSQFAHWNSRFWPPRLRRRPRPICIPLSGDLTGSIPSKGLPENHREIEQWIDRKATVLLVGTVEPRKGFDQALAAFELLWKQTDANAPQLLLVGRPGWKTNALQKKLERRSSMDGPFLWMREASDEFLERIYLKAKFLLFPSRGEGFGLPISEALHRGLPVLYRDLPELKQFAGMGTTCFKGDKPGDLAQAVTQCLNQPVASTHPNAHASRSWDAVAIELANALQLRLAPVHELSAGGSDAVSRHACIKDGTYR